MIPLLVLSTLSLNQFTGQLQRHTENSFQQLVIHLSKNVDDVLLNYNEISKTMYYSTESSMFRLHESLLEDGAKQEKLNVASIDDFLLSILYSDSHIQNAFFVRASDEAIFHQSRVSKVLDPNEPFPLINWTYALSASPKKLVIIPAHLESYYRSTDQVMTIARNLFDTSGKLGADAKLLGTLYFDVDLDIFDRILRQVKLSGSDQMVIVDGNGYTLYSNQQDKLGKRFDENAARMNRDMLMFAEPIPFIGGQVIGLISKKDLYASATPIRSTVLIVAAVCMAALILLGILFSRRFTRPILGMMRLMVKVESGYLEPVPDLKRNDELGRLWHGFNRMIARLQWFINDSYISEIKRKQAELNALKSQIRPHYLYNTLEVIRMSAVSNNDEEVADMIHSLSNQLQYTIDYGDEWVSLEQEIKHVKHYFHLIEVRYDRRIELQIDVEDDSLHDAQILKLSLQPLVENAIIHGLRPLGNKGTVQITVERTETNNLTITVYDNGVGIDEAAVERLNRSLQESEGATGKSIGLKNVHERVRQSCGEAYGIVVQSRKQIGTAVLILYPLRTKEAEA
jgi:two-component system sensor histidine kinase YesM